VDVEGYSHLFRHDVQRRRSYLADTIVFQISVEHSKQNKIIRFGVWEFSFVTLGIFIPKLSVMHKLSMSAQV